MELDFKFSAEGLIPAIVQQVSEGNGPCGRVLMFAWMNREAIERSLATGFMHYWSRSRKKLWLKGEISGHRQKISRWFADCDRDVLLFEVEQIGGACHTGYLSCFFQEFDLTGASLPVRERKSFDEESVYGKPSATT